MTKMPREERLAAIIAATLRSQGYKLPKGRRAAYVSKRKAEEFWRDRFKERVRELFI